MLYFFRNVLRFLLPIGDGDNISVGKDIILAAQRVRTQLNENASSFPDIFTSIEEAKNKNDLKVAFGRLNDVMLILSLIGPLTEPTGIVYEVLNELKFSKKFGFYLNTAPTVEEAIVGYKTSVVKEVSRNYRKIENFKKEQANFENNLFDKYFPPNVVPPSQMEGTEQQKLTELCESIISPCRKRTYRKCIESGTILNTEMSPKMKSDKTRLSFEKMSSERKRRRSTRSSYEEVHLNNAK